MGALGEALGTETKSILIVSQHVTMTIQSDFGLGAGDISSRDGGKLMVAGTDGDCPISGAAGAEPLVAANPLPGVGDTCILS